MNTFTDPRHGTLTVERHLAEGRSFDAVVARRPDGSLAMARAPRYAEPGDADELAARIDAAEREVAMAASDCPHLPRKAELWHVAPDDAPVVVYDFIEGRRLDTWLADNAPTGMSTERLLAFARDIATGLSDLHGRGFVHRSISPEHVIITPDLRAVVVGLGNGSVANEPACRAKDNIDEAYSAPEIQSELSGRFNTIRSDVYGFGLLLAFMATGERPTGDVGSPITRTAYARLREGDDGVALLIAKCTQPLQKSRFSSVAKVSGYLHEDALPTERSEGFGPLALLAPWGRGEPETLRVGHLSPGPLVDRPRAAAEREESHPGAAEARPGAAETESMRDARSLRLGWVIGALVLLAALYVTIVTLSR